jgi:transposase
MTTRMLFVGLDVHKETITVAVAEEGRDAEVRSHATIKNTSAEVTRLFKRLGKPGKDLHCCYEAGPCGYGLYRQIVDAGHQCMVVAPSSIPIKTGERVKTDRRDAMKLARLLRAGELTAVWVPDPAHEAMRDLVRSRTNAMWHLHSAKRQLLAFLLRQGRTYSGIKLWGRAHREWLADQRFEHPAHQIVFQDYVNAVHDGDQRHKQLIAMIEKADPRLVAEAAARGIACDARHRHCVGRHHSMRHWRPAPVSDTREVKRILRSGAVRTFEWWDREAGGDYQDRQQ